MAVMFTADCGMEVMAWIKILLKTTFCHVVHSFQSTQKYGCITTILVFHHPNMVVRQRKDQKHNSTCPLFHYNQ